MTENDLIMPMNFDGVNFFILDPNPEDTANLLGTMDSSSREYSQYLKIPHMNEIQNTSSMLSTLHMREHTIVSCEIN